MDALDLHTNGVHTECTFPTKKRAGVKYIGDGSHRACTLAGTVEQYHTHSFDGPLWAACGCPEYAD